MSRLTQDTTRTTTAYVYGTITRYGVTFQKTSTSPLSFILWSYNLTTAETIVIWAVPCSLATTGGITIVLFSAGYLDVSVPRVYRPIARASRSSTWRVAPFGNLRINSYLHFPGAYRSLSRPSSSLRAKASAMCS